METHLVKKSHIQFSLETIIGGSDLKTVQSGKSGILSLLAVDRELFPRLYMNEPLPKTIQMNVGKPGVVSVRNLATRVRNLVENHASTIDFLIIIDC